MTSAAIGFDHFSGGTVRMRTRDDDSQVVEIEVVPNGAESGVTISVYGSELDALRAMIDAMQLVSRS